MSPLGDMGGGDYEFVCYCEYESLVVYRCYSSYTTLHLQCSQQLEFLSRKFGHGIIILRVSLMMKTGKKIG